MKTKSILATILCATLLLAGCSKEENMDKGPAGTQRTMTFTLRTPAGDKVIYTKATHDEPEYKINRLTLYEYEVADDGTTTTLSRILKYPDGLGDNTLDLVDGGNGTYTFSIIIPQSNDGKKFAYKFIANDAPADPAVGSSFDGFKTTEATVALTEGNTADALAADGTGIAMSGVAKNGTDETITMQNGITCTVQMTRIVSRVDIKYETPNLKVTKVELQNAPKKGYLFPQDALTAPATEDDKLTLGLNANVTLPTGYLKDDPDQTVVEMKKAFYLYERSNEDGNTAQVHIEYEVAANGTTYTGAVDVPFKKTSDDLGYVNAQRNHLYTIVLGHADDPVAGKVTAKLVVDEWNSVEIDEPMTEDIIP